MQAQQSIASWLPGLLVLLAGCMTTVRAAENDRVWSPEAGVVCDSRGGFCADHEGLSMGLTRQWLGEQAQSRLMQMVSGTLSMNTRDFTLTTGEHCESASRTCWTDRYREARDEKLTRQLYGDGKP